MGGISYADSVIHAEHQLMTSDSKYIATRDIAHATVLHYKKFKLIQTEWSGGIASWKFEADQGRAVKAVRDYQNGKVTGNLKRFVDSQRTIKQTLFNQP